MPDCWKTVKTFESKVEGFEYLPEGLKEPLILTDVICEQPLIKKHVGVNICSSSRNRAQFLFPNHHHHHHHYHHCAGEVTQSSQVAIALSESLRSDGSRDRFTCPSIFLSRFLRFVFVPYFGFVRHIRFGWAGQEGLCVPVIMIDCWKLPIGVEIAVSCTRAACPCRKFWTSPKKLPIATSSINCNQKWDAAGDDSAVIAVILLCKSWPWLRGGWGVVLGRSMMGGGWTPAVTGHFLS